MENTLLVGLSRQVALQRELDVVANNIANMNTSGYKADGNVFQEYLMPVARADQFPGPDRRISYVQDRSTWHDMSSGAVQQTGNPLDVAVDGNAYLVVQTPRGERYTRNGALQINAQGQLVTSEGHPVIGENGPIVFQPTDSAINIAKDGTVTVREGAGANTESQRGKIRLASFAQPQRLRKDGSTTFAAPQGVQAEAVVPGAARLVQGAIERSNVKAVVEMSRMIEVTRHYTNVAGLMDRQSELRKSAIERLAEVPS